MHDMAESGISLRGGKPLSQHGATIVVCGSEIDRLEGRPVVEGSRRVEIVASPEMLIGELAGARRLD